LIDLATCVGGETTKCAQQCGPPLVKCVSQAIFGGSGISGVKDCFVTFIKCSKDCLKSEEELFMVDDAVVEKTVEDFHNTFPHVESFADCVKAEKECMNASTGLQKFKCLIDLATCVGSETAKCAQQCGPPVVKCVKDAIFGGKPADVPKCFVAFIKCAKDCAKSSEEALFMVDDAVVEKTVEDFHNTFPHVESYADCIKAEKECMSASTGLQKFKCLIDLATCVGTETAKCAQQCGPPVVKCVKDAIFGGKPADVPKCFAGFIKCAADCAKSS